MHLILRTILSHDFSHYFPRLYRCITVQFIQQFSPSMPQECSVKSVSCQDTICIVHIRPREEHVHVTAHEQSSRPPNATTSTQQGRHAVAMRAVATSSVAMPDSHRPTPFDKSVSSSRPCELDNIDNSRLVADGKI